MFGGDNTPAQDDGAQPAQDNNTLNGVSDLAGAPTPAAPPPAYDGGFMSTPGDPVQAADVATNDGGGGGGPTLPAPGGPDGAAPAATGDLLDLKQQALQQLSPLVGHLDQTPEEKFRTHMMMIQATDNQALLKDALATAQQITDDKARAQALLDIVNEINYFSQNKSQEHTS